MHESRANRTKENGEWRYFDQNDAEFVFMSSFDYPVEFVDDFIDGLHGVTLTDKTISELGGIRHDALHAYTANNIELMESNLRALDIACRLAGMVDSAKLGVKFKRGRRINATGPIRKAITKLLTKNPMMKNPELWDEIKNNLPKGWELETPRYFYFKPSLIGPNPSKDHVTQSRFNNICGEERKKIKQKSRVSEPVKESC
ncbi:MAG: hypothetical protein RIR18_1909 [Pseudomonadota bacterium]